MQVSVKLLFSCSLHVIVVYGGCRVALCLILSIFGYYLKTQLEIEVSNSHNDLVVNEIDILF